MCVATRLERGPAAADASVYWRTHASPGSRHGSLVVGGGCPPWGRIAPVNVFDAWLIIVGLAIGAGLAWLVMLDLRRRDDDIAAREQRAEAAWIADTLRSRAIAADAEAVEEVLRLHRAYLAGIPDDGASGPASAPASASAFDDAYEVAYEEPRGRAVATAASALSPAAALAGPKEPGEAALEPAWADEDLDAAHEALETLLNKAPPED